MIESKPKVTVKIFDNILHAGLLTLGLYFIYQGNVINRFQQRRCNFAEYDEPVTELPTIVTRMDQLPSNQESLKFRKNFWILLGKEMEDKWLLEGENSIFGFKLKVVVRYSSRLKQEVVQLIPVNTPKDITEHPLRLKYKFSNTVEVSKVVIALSSRNNSHCGFGSSAYDGDIAHTETNPGVTQIVFLSPEKYLFIKGADQCRERPYNDLRVDRILEYMKANCSKTCRSYDYWICNPDLESLFTVCEKDSEDQACFMNALEMTEKDTIPMKPCTKVQYKVPPELGTSYQHVESTEAQFEFWFTKPSKVTVKEEYLIYDLVSMISAIGGTMSLCAGLNFLRLKSFLMQLCKFGFDHLCPNKKG